MKWFFAFNEAATSTFGDMIRVAVVSAQEKTSLEAHCLYDGAETSLTAWLRARGVTIWPRRSRFCNMFEARYQQTGDESLRVFAPGAFLRVEVPRLLQENGIEDERVLYTDSDLVFLSDPTPILAKIRPRYFAAAPQSWQQDYLHMNSGVMLFNIPAMRAVEAAFERFIRARFARMTRRNWDIMPYRDRVDLWDQGAYRTFFDPLHRALWNLGITDRMAYKFLLKPLWSRHQWDDLPPQLNWKPYWGQQEDVVILHFHGPKPWERRTLEENGGLAATPLYNRHFGAWCDFWEAQRALLEPLPLSPP